MLKIYQKNLDLFRQEVPNKAHFLTYARHAAYLLPEGRYFREHCERSEPAGSGSLHTRRGWIFIQPLEKSGGPCRGSNLRPAGYEPEALPTELRARHPVGSDRNIGTNVYDLKTCFWQAFYRLFPRLRKKRSSIFYLIRESTPSTDRTVREDRLCLPVCSRRCSAP